MKYTSGFFLTQTSTCNVARLGVTLSAEDEFLIQATGPGMEDRSWTRSTLAVAQHIADKAITKLGYAYAEVRHVPSEQARNQFGGHLSDPLYKVEKIARPPGEPTNEMRLSMKRVGIDPDEWLKNARKPQPDLLSKFRR